MGNRSAVAAKSGSAGDDFQAQNIAQSAARRFCPSDMTMDTIYDHYCGKVGSGEHPSQVVGAAERFDALKEYGSSIYSKAKEQLIRDICHDAAKVLGIKPEFAYSASLDKVVSRLRAIVPDPRSKARVRSDKQEHVCRELAKALNHRYGYGLIDMDASPNEICVVVSELVYSLFVGLHSEFLTVAGDMSRIVKNLNVLRDYVEAAFKSLLQEIESGLSDDTAIERSRAIKEIYEKIQKEIDRQLAVLNNMMNVVISPTSKSMITLLEENKDFKGLVADLKEAVGTERFGDKLGYLLAGVSSVTHAAELVNKALKTVGMSVKDYKNTKSLGDLRLKLYDLIAKKHPNSSQLHKMYTAMDILYKNDYSHDDVASYLEKKGGAAGGIEIRDLDVDSERDVAGRRFLKKESLEKRIRTQDKTREMLFHDLNKIIQHHFQKIVAAAKRIAPKLGNEIPITDDVETFIRRFQEIPHADRENLHKALSGYRKDMTSKWVKNDFMTALSVLSECLNPLIHKSSKMADAFRDIKHSVDSLILAIDDFNDTFVKAITELPTEGTTLDSGVYGSAERYLKEIIDRSDPAIFEHYVTFKQAQTLLFYYYRISNIKKNMNVMGAEMKNYHTNYENLLGDEIGFMINQINEEYNQTVKDADYEDPKLEQEMTKPPRYLLGKLFRNGIVTAKKLLEHFTEKTKPTAAGNKTRMCQWMKGLTARRAIGPVNIGININAPTFGYKHPVAASAPNTDIEPQHILALADNLCDVAFNAVDIQANNWAAAVCVADNDPVGARIPTFDYGAGVGAVWAALGANAGTLTPAEQTNEVERIKKAMESAISINKERHRVYLAMHKYQRDAKIQLLKTAEAVDLYLQAFTDGVTAHPEDLKDLIKLLEHIDIVAQWFNEQSGNNLVRLFESFPQQERIDLASRNEVLQNGVGHIQGASHVLNSNDGLISTGVIASGRPNNSEHYYNYVLPGPDDPTVPARWLGDIRTGLVINKIEHLKSLLQQTSKCVKGVRALENLLSTFAGIGKKFGERQPMDKTFMSIGEMFKSFMDYIVASSFCIGRSPQYSSVAIEALGGGWLMAATSAQAALAAAAIANAAGAPPAVININDGSPTYANPDAQIASSWAYLKMQNILNNVQGAGAAIPGEPGKYDAIPHDAAAGIDTILNPANGHANRFLAISSIGAATAGQVALPGLFEGEYNNNAAPDQAPQFAIDRRNAYTSSYPGTLSLTDQLEIVLCPSDRESEGDPRDRFFHRMPSKISRSVKKTLDDTMKAIVAKVLTSIGVFSMFNRPQIVNEYNSLSSVRMIVGGGAYSGSSYPEIIEKASELYLRLPLLAEWYREKFRFQKNSNTPDQNYKISMVPSATGVFNEFISIVFRDADFIKDGTYTDTVLIRLINSINEIYRTYSRKSSYNAMDIILAFVIEINRRYGVIKQSEINAYLDNIRSNLSAEDEYATENQRVDFDILNAEGSHGRRPAPSDRFQDVSITKPKQRKSAREDLERVAREFRESIESDLNSVLRQGTDKLYNYTKLRFSFSGSIKQAKEALELTKDPKMRFDVIAKLVQGASRYTTVEAEKLLAFNELVVMPLTTLNYVYEILYQFNAFIHGSDMKYLTTLYNSANAAVGTTPNVNNLRTHLEREYSAVFKPTNDQRLFDIGAVIQQYAPGFQVNSNSDRMTYFYNQVMYRLLDNIFSIGSDLSGLAEIRILSEGIPSVDLSKIQDVCIKVYQQTRSIIDRFRHVFPKELIDKYENRTNGGVFYLEENMFELLFNNRDKLGLPEVNTKIASIWKELTKKDVLGDDATNLANSIKYDMAFSKLIYWHNKDTNNDQNVSYTRIQVVSRDNTNWHMAPFKLFPVFKNGGFEPKTPEEQRAFDMWKKGAHRGNAGADAIDPAFDNARTVMHSDVKRLFDACKFVRGALQDIRDAMTPNAVANIVNPLANAASFAPNPQPPPPPPAAQYPHDFAMAYDNMDNAYQTFIANPIQQNLTQLEAAINTTRNVSTQAYDAARTAAADAQIIAVANAADLGEVRDKLAYLIGDPAAPPNPAANSPVGNLRAAAVAAIPVLRAYTVPVPPLPPSVLVHFAPEWYKFYNLESDLSWNKTTRSLGFKGLLVAFNNLVARFIYGLLDQTEDKFYLPMLETLANGVLSKEVFQHQGICDLGVNNKLNRVEVFDGDANIKGDPPGTPPSVLFASLATAIHSLMTVQNKLGSKMFGTNSFAELSYSTKENMRVNLPIFEKMLNMIINKASFIKELLESKANIRLERELLAVAGVAAAAGGRAVAAAAAGGRVHGPADGPDAIGGNNSADQFVFGYFRPEPGHHGGLARAKQDTHNNRQSYLLHMLNRIIGASQNMLKGVMVGQKELADIPVYMELSEDSIKDFMSTNNGKLPLMPLSSLSVLFDQNVDLGLNFNVGSDEFKLLYATRQLLTKNNVEPDMQHMPGIKHIISEYNALVDTAAKIGGARSETSSRVNTLVTDVVKLTRYAMDVTQWKPYFCNMFANAPLIYSQYRYAADGTTTVTAVRSVSPVQTTGNVFGADAGFRVAMDTTGVHLPFGFGGPANAIGAVDANAIGPHTYFMLQVSGRDGRITPYQHDDDDGQQHSLGNILMLSESSGISESIKKIVRRVDPQLDQDRGMNDDRAKLRVLNILDMNIVPINFHALQREIPMINLYNYSYTFDRMIQEMLVPGASFGANVYIMPATHRANNSSEMLTKMLIYPTGVRGQLEYYNHIPRLISGDTRIDLGIPKYISDQLWNKVLLNTTHYLSPQDINNTSHNDEAGARAENAIRRARMNDDANRVNFSADGTFDAATVLRYIRPSDDTDVFNISYPDAKNRKRVKPKGFHLGDRAAGELQIDILKQMLEKGRERYDTALIRNLEWFANLQRVMRLIIRDHMRWVATPVVSGLAVANRNITEYTQENTISNQGEIDLDYY